MLDGIELIKAGAGLPVSDTASRLMGKKLRPVKVYGWHVDPSKSDPAQAVTYLADAVGKTPAAMGSTAFSYGGWEDAFFMPKPCMLRYDGTVAYYLDPNDYTKKADGTASDVADTSFGGNAMMEWPLIWYKFVPGEADGEGSFYCSDKQADSSYKCWCNTDADGNVIPHFYTAIYNGCIVSQKLRSLSGQALNQYTAYEVSFSDFVDKAAANNAGANKEWDTDVYADRALINALLVLISKTLDTQSAFGKGFTGGRPPIQRSTGRLDANGLFYGESTGNEFVKVFGMENYWGCLIRRTRGLTAKNGKYLYKLTRGTADGSSAADYNLTGDNYIEAFAPPPGLWEADAEISSMRFGPYGMLPQSSVRNSSFDTFYCDKLMPVTIETPIAQGGWTSGTRQSPSDTYYPLRVSSTDKRWIAGKGQYIFDAPDADSDVQIAVQLFDGSTRTLDTGWHTLPFALDLTAFYGQDYIVLFKKTDDSAIVPSDVGISVHKLTAPVTVGFGGHITRGIDAGAFELWPTDVDSLESLYGAALSCKPVNAQ